jgi:hypothetical protein
MALPACTEANLEKTRALGLRRYTSVMTCCSSSCTARQIGGQYLTFAAATGISKPSWFMNIVRIVISLGAQDAWHILTSPS